MYLKRCLVLLLFFSFTVAQAQQHRKEFGQNRVQYKKFEWQVYSTDDYDIHHYFLGEEYADFALDYLEEEFDKITDLLGYAPFSKTKIFLYNSPIDLKQSNIGVDGNTFTIAGQTNFVKLQVEIAYSGNIVEFKEELNYQITNLLLNDMMFGGSLADMFQSSYLLNLPEWFIPGASRYAAYEWSVDMDDFVRDFLANNKLRKLNRLEGREAELIGQSVWNYIALKYGRSNLSNILNLTRIIRNVEHSIASSLGISFKQFMYEWAEYYNNANAALESAYIAPKKDDKLVSNRGKLVKLTKVKMSPDGKKVAYVKNYKGKYTVYIQDLASGKEHKALKGGNHSINQKVNADLPLIDWITNDKLGIVQNWYGTNYLVSYDLKTRSKQRKSLIRFNQIKDIGFNESGKLAVVSADVQGQNDLYLISLRRNAIKKLTKDKYDDLYPQFIPGTDAIVFSSNRPSDSLHISGYDANTAPDLLNLFALDLDTTNQVLHQLTNTVSDDIYPMAVDKENVFFLSDQKGINNLYSYNFTNGVYRQVSNYKTSITEYDINPTTHDLTYLMLNDGKNSIYLEKDFNIEQSVFTPPTLRVQLDQVELLQKRRKEQEALQLAEQVTEMGDGLFDVDANAPTQEKEEDAQDDFIDTDDYQFEDESVEDGEEGFSFLSTYQKMQSQPTVTGPLPYETLFSSNNVITTFQIDPLRGFGVLMEYEMSDILENHKFYGGIMAITDLKSGDFFAEYQFLKYTVDLKFRYDRKAYLHESFSSDVNSEELTQKYKKNTFNLGASLPFSASSRVDLAAIITNTSYNNLDADLIKKSNNAADYISESKNNFLGIKGQWVYDNTLTNGLNLYEGSRAKVSYEHHQSISPENRSYSKVTIDLRRYQKIHKEFIFASRFFYGKSFGKRPVNYMLGGVDNWVFNTSNNTDDKSSPLYFSNTKDNTDILFTEFVNLRGFNYNKLSGSNVLSVNAELRLPIAKYLTRGTIKSNFLRNLQFIGFYDVGSAWTGVAPFSLKTFSLNENHTVNTKVIKDENSNIQATINTSNNPWLSSLGFGLRTVLFGYYARLDFARPLENYNRGNTNVYLSLGYDF